MGKVINFHKVTNKKWFESVVCLLKKRYTMIGADQMIDYYCHHQVLPSKSCLITVDDGDMTSYTVIYPILKKYHIPAIFFVSPQKITRSGKHRNFWFQEVRSFEDAEQLMDKIHNGSYEIDDIWEMIDCYRVEHQTNELSEQNMTLDQVLEIDREGLVAFGAHTMEHPFLARESDERSANEIITSIDQLAKMLGHSVHTFAYPNGQPGLDFGQREMETLRKTSCQIAFSTQPKDFSERDVSLAIPRFGLSCGSLLFIKIKLMLGAHYQTVKCIVRGLKRFVKTETN